MVLTGQAAVQWTVSAACLGAAALNRTIVGLYALHAEASTLTRGTRMQITLHNRQVHHSYVHLPPFVLHLFVCTQVLAIAQGGLDRRGYDEGHFLKQLHVIAESGMSPASHQLELYNTSWNHSVDPLWKDFMY